MLPKRAFYRLLKKEVKRVQTHFRMWSDRRVYLFFKRQVGEFVCQRRRKERCCRKRRDLCRVVVASCCGFRSQGTTSVILGISCFWKFIDRRVDVFFKARVSQSVYGNGRVL